VSASTRLAGAVGGAGLAELVWSVPGGAPRAIAVVPLLLNDAPAVALPWAYEEQARAAAAAGSAALVLSEPRLAGPTWEPLTAVGGLLLVEDGEGELFCERLLDQELRKHPPARALAGSPLLRREHWWYQPRLVLLLESAQVLPIGARRGPQDAVLAVDDDGLQVATVQVTDWEVEPLRLVGGPADPHGPAVLVGQEVSEPDAERWTAHVTSGRYEDGRLLVTQRPPTRELEGVPGLRTRVRRQRELERACVKALRAAGHG
jgi:hypothetical protein